MEKRRNAGEEGLHTAEKNRRNIMFEEFHIEPSCHQDCK
jgi:hypothetical protein